MPGKISATALIALILLSILVAPVQAQSSTTTSESGDSGSGITVDVDIPLDELVGLFEELLNEFESFSSDLDETVADVLIQVFFKPFQVLANTLSDLLIHVLTSYPDLTSSDVLELHSLIFRLELLLSGIGFSIIGYAYLVGPLFGLSYSQVRPLLPRLFAALVFGGVAPWLLNYLVKGSELVTLALKPANPGFWVVTQLSAELILITVVNALLLLGVAILFVIRDVYLLFAAVSAPLIALGWALPYTKRFADPLIGVFFGFLLIGPLDMIIYRLVLNLLEVNAYEFPRFLYAAGGITLMLGVPYIVLNTGMSIVATASTAYQQSSLDISSDENQNPGEEERRSAYSRRRGTGSNRFQPGSDSE